MCVGRGYVGGSDIEAPDVLFHLGLLVMCQVCVKEMVVRVCVRRGHVGGSGNEATKMCCSTWFC